MKLLYIMNIHRRTINLTEMDKINKINEINKSKLTNSDWKETKEAESFE